MSVTGEQGHETDELHVQMNALLTDRLGLDVTDEQSDLIESGQLDSLSLVMLISAIEDTFACEVPLEDFDIDHFRTVERICAFLRHANIPAVGGG